MPEFTQLTSGGTDLNPAARLRVHILTHHTLLSNRQGGQGLAALSHSGSLTPEAHFVSKSKILPGVRFPHIASLVLLFLS